MKYFKEMVNVINEGLYRKDKHVLNLVKEAEVFIFSPKDGVQKDLEDGDYYSGKLDLPFKVVSFEFAGNTPLTSMKELDDTNGDINLISVLIEEVEAFKFNFYYLLKTKENGVDTHKPIILSVKHNATKETEKSMYDWSVTLLNEMIQRLASEKMGSEPVREKFKVGTGKNKYFHKIKRVIHVAPKDIMKKVVSSSSRDIDWKHRWSSMGHWRNFYLDSNDHSKGIDKSKLGKDRDDNVCVVGRTWVNESVKGPKDKPLIKKQRVVA